ncbi:MAG: nucleoside phosphorylase [Flavobacteriales bacterium]
MQIKESELILNNDGSIYHVNLRPEHLADRIILVGDPNRVPKVSAFFDTIKFKREKREMVTHTGTFNGKQFTVISTGMGPDNIDIALTELDAVANVDFEKREVKKELRSLTFVRMGTSGSFQADIPVDSYVAAEYSIGFDNVLHSYKTPDHFFETDIEEAFIKHTHWNPDMGRPYVIKTDSNLVHSLLGENTVKGFTGTAGGFYGPQGREIRLHAKDHLLNDKISSFRYNDLKINNMEMETSAIYGLSKLLGHKACSMNCIIANRATQTFSHDPYASVEKMIEYTLNKMSDL